MRPILVAHIYMILISYPSKGGTKEQKVTLFKDVVADEDKALAVAKDLKGDNGLGQGRLFVEITTTYTL